MAQQSASQCHIPATTAHTEMAQQSRTRPVADSSNAAKDQVSNAVACRAKTATGSFSIMMRAAEVQLDVEHQLPVLLYESYPIKIRIKNCENVDIHSAM